jgi:predicted transcriptional regulator
MAPPIVAATGATTGNAMALTVTSPALAERLEKAQSFVSVYENGQRRIDIPEFIEIVRTIGADPVREFQMIVTKLGDQPRSRRHR